MAKIIQAAVADPGAQPLIDGLYTEYRALYGGLAEEELDRYAPGEFDPPAGTFLLVVAGDETVAGGGLRRWSDGIGEVKRMWTSPGHRRRGHGTRVLAALEDAARASGYRSVRLETGSLQEPAVRMYHALGYRRIPGYGQYADHPLHVCFQKTLVPSPYGRAEPRPDAEGHRLVR